MKSDQKRRGDAFGEIYDQFTVRPAEYAKFMLDPDRVKPRLVDPPCNLAIAFARRLSDLQRRIGTLPTPHHRDMVKAMLAFILARVLHDIACEGGEATSAGLTRPDYRNFCIR